MQKYSDKHHQMMLMANFILIFQRLVVALLAVI